MTKLVYIFCAVLLSVFSSMAQNMPRLERVNNSVHLVVDDKPMLLLGGELGNSTAATEEGIALSMSKLQQMHLNTVLMPVYWELFEPEENKFDYSLVQKMIKEGENNHLRVVLLWFGAWKNSMSCYAPLWVKEDVKRFPRVLTKEGRAQEIASPYYPEILESDRKALVALMKFLKNNDPNHTVVMLQVENEIGMIPQARDYSALAQKQYESQVPASLIRYLKKHKASLDPSLLARWKSQNFTEKGDWESVFGPGIETEEIFQAYGFACYVEQMAAAAKNEYALPLYVNTALNSRNRRPGDYPSAGPLAHLMDIWHCAAPSIDILAPDIYDPGFTDWCRQYDVKGNPLFIPEIRLEPENGVRAFYAFGNHNALGFSPFAIEDVADVKSYPLCRSYQLISQIQEQIIQAQRKDLIKGVWFDNVKRTDTLCFDTSSDKEMKVRNTLFTIRHDYSLGWNPAALDGSLWPETGALIMQISSDEFIVAGSGVEVRFRNQDENGPIVGIARIDQLRYNNGCIVSRKRLNGDQTHQGRHLRIPVGEWDIQYVKLYAY